MCSATNTTQHLEVSIAEQSLKLFEGKHCVEKFSISTGKNGAGELAGSECTPRGWHVIQEMIGEGAPLNAVFVGRQTTGEIYDEALDAANPQRDWVLTRILWLSGIEQGKNYQGEVDTLRRYIYIHGCPDKLSMGKPLSHGCIRMNNNDIVALFSLLQRNVKVNIIE